MSVMTVQPDTASPAEERRGGEHPDWDRARPGEALPEREAPPGPGEVLDSDDCGRDDRGVAPLLHWCGTPGCGGD